jgi:hypothetical protein
MDELSLIENRLAAAERHVADGAKLVTLQRDILARLERDGRDATTARKLLITFEVSLASHVAERERLNGERKRVAGGI